MGPILSEKCLFNAVYLSNTSCGSANYDCGLSGAKVNVVIALQNLTERKSVWIVGSIQHVNLTQQTLASFKHNKQSFPKLSQVLLPKLKNDFFIDAMF